MKISFSTFISVLFFSLGFPSWTHASDEFDGSISFLVNQRFFDDSQLSYVNGFSEWGALSFDLSVGLLKLPYGLEPLLGFGYIQNSAGKFGISASGQATNILSTDSLEYKIFSASTGLRYVPWQPDYFYFIPYLEGQVVYRYGRVVRHTAAVTDGTSTPQKVNTGGEFGAILGTGVRFSFMYDQARKVDLLTNYGLTDFGLTTSIRYLPSGWFRQGLGEIKNAGGWDFGGGLYMEW